MEAPVYVVCNPDFMSCGAMEILKPVLSDDFLVPLGAVFDGALLRFVIYPDDAEALGIAA
jgi:hypothetical protein